MNWFKTTVEATPTGKTKEADATPNANISIGVVINTMNENPNHQVEFNPKHLHFPTTADSSKDFLINNSPITVKNAAQVVANNPYKKKYSSESSETPV